MHFHFTFTFYCYYILLQKNDDYESVQSTWYIARQKVLFSAVHKLVLLKTQYILNTYVHTRNIANSTQMIVFSQDNNNKSQ